MSRLLVLVISIAFSLVSLVAQGRADAASFQLTWADNSPDEDGFNVERKTGMNGTFEIIVSLGPNVTSYTDSALADATAYCYRMNAFNSAGSSDYSDEVCGTTPSLPSPPQTFVLTVSSQGSGTITSNPAGISCGSNCAATVTSGTTVVLQAAPASGFSFNGWSGDPDCLDGSVTMDANKSCAATFTATTVQTPKLTVNVVASATVAGTGKGVVTSNPAGINCKTNCSANFASGTSVTLIATANPGSVFSGWSGDADCSDGTVTMSSSKSCTATFTVEGYFINVILKGNGKGQVTGNPGSIDCVTDCSARYNTPTRVALRAIPALGSAFTGWSGDRNCAGGVVVANGNTSCVATFEQRPSSIGVFKTTTHEWQLKRSFTATNNGCNTEPCINPWKKKSIPTLGSVLVPVVGDWNRSGTDDLGIYAPAATSNKASRWYLDRNGNERWNGCDDDRCIRSFGRQGDLPVAGDWNGTGRTKIGVFRPTTGEWFLDLDGDGRLDSCSIDRCIASFAQQGDLPVVGDWDATGTSKIGLFRPSTGEWFLDLNGNGIWDGCNVDQCIAAFGQPGDLPIAGDWDAAGTSKIGLFRPATGDWFLDLNGNGQWDGCSVDKCITSFGQEGDLPVAGKW
ncbi:MAG TPA: InlB B-repeat-containing protein [Candidatus Binatia bacterium]|jgi:hypothetical protein